MIRKIDHIGVAVEKIEDAKMFFENILGLNISKIEEVPEQNVKIAFIPVGESKIELLEPLENGAVSKFIKKKGEGIQHISLLVDDIEKAMQNMKEKGAVFIDEKPRLGAGGTKIAFIHPKSSHGVLVELCEFPAAEKD